MRVDILKRGAFKFRAFKFSDFKIGWRLLLAEPAYSFVSIAGLAIGFATCFLLLGFVRYCWQYNAEVPDVDKVYVVKQRWNGVENTSWFDLTPCLLRPAASSLPGVESAAELVSQGATTFRAGAQLHKLLLKVVIADFPKLMGLKVQEGDIHQALNTPDGVAITDQVALRVFGTTHAIGSTMQTAGKTLHVAAILQSPASNSTIPVEVLVGPESVTVDSAERSEIIVGTEGHFLGSLLLRLKPGVSASSVTDALQAALDSTPYVQKGMTPTKKARLGNQKMIDIKLSPLADAYFDQDITDKLLDSGADRGNPVVVNALAGIAVVILALAAINYVNLASVRVLRRQREIVMSKVLCSSPQKIVGKFVIESLLVVMLAAGIGMLLAWLCLPMFSELMNRKLENIFTAPIIAAALVISIVVGLLTAIYPTWIALRVRPMQILMVRPNTESTRGMQLRRMMTVIQIAAALGLASVAMAIAWQAKFAMQIYPGFDTNSLVIVDLPDFVKGNADAQGFITELRHQASVAGVAISLDAVGRSNARYGMHIKRANGVESFLDFKTVSTNFFELYRISPTAGRLFNSGLDKDDDSEPVVLNALAAKELGFATPEQAIGQLLFHGDLEGHVFTERVIGIAPDLRFYSLHEAQKATAYELSTDMGTLTVRASGSVAQTGQAIQSIWPKYYPNETLELHSASDILGANYADDARLARLLTISTGIALALAACGIYALSAYAIQRRSAEIVLRKLYGARSRDIVRLVVFEIGTLLVIAAAVGLPPAALAIQRYLAAYVEHAAIGYWTLLFAIGVAIVIATAAVARSTWIALRLKPALAFAN